jgi:SnoaL-like domain
VDDRERLIIARSCLSLHENVGGTMTTTANKALVSRYYDEVLTQRNLAALDDLLAPGFASWLSDGTRAKRAEYRKAVLASHQAFPDLAVEVLDQLGEGDTGTHRGPFAGSPRPAGR